MKDLKNMTEPELRELLNILGRRIDQKLPVGTLWVTLVFDDPGLAQYVSNANRKDIIKAMRECADRLEAKEDIERS